METKSPIFNQPASQITLAAKRVLDLVVSIAFLTIVSPFLIAIAVVIKLDSSGPVFFVNSAIGKNGASFGMIKFRSMRHGADDTMHRERTKAFVQQDETGWTINPQTGAPIYKIVDDPRITRFGKFLRRTSLDETPQFINVFLGQMSVVGPRPVLPYEYELYDERAKSRLAVKAGLTGVNQVYRRSMANFTECLDADIQYAENLSFCRDLKIILLTVPAIMRGKGSY